MEAETQSQQLFRRADQSEFIEAEYVRRIWSHTPGAGARMEDLLIPEYWSKLVHSLRCGDRIEASPADSSWFLELLVRSVGTEGILMMRLRGGVLEGVATPPGASEHIDLEATIEYGGPLLKWQVFATDGRVLKSGLATQDMAIGWVAELRRTQARS
jgi:hypothetical protein